MKKKLHLLLLAMLMPLFMLAENQGYAVFDESTGTLTFKYGGKPEGDNVFDTDNTGNPRWDCSKIKIVKFDLTYGDARPISTNSWFNGAVSLSEIIGIENLNTSAVTDMGWMFKGCSGLTSLDVSGFKTDNVTEMGGMFN